MYWSFNVAGIIVLNMLGIDWFISNHDPLLRQKKFNKKQKEFRSGIILFIKAC